MLASDILLPVFTLAGWTAFVQALIPVARIHAARHGVVTLADFKYGESPAVPGTVSIPNRNYMNLLEFPVLFYVIAGLLYASSAATPVTVNLAWTFVALRILHSAIHLTYNRVIHRVMAFGASNFALVTLWIVAGRALFA